MTKGFYFVVIMQEILQSHDHLQPHYFRFFPRNVLIPIIFLLMAKNSLTIKQYDNIALDPFSIIIFVIQTYKTEIITITMYYNIFPVPEKGKKAITN